MCEFALSPIESQKTRIFARATKCTEGDVLARLNGVQSTNPTGYLLGGLINQAVRISPWGLF